MIILAVFVDLFYWVFSTMHECTTEYEQRKGLLNNTVRIFCCGFMAQIFN